MKKVEVDADAIRTIMAFLCTRQVIAPEVIKGALVKLSEALDNVPLKDFPLQAGLRAKPKPGSNYLRAGHTAYDEAVIVSVNPFVLVSKDGKHIWEGLDEELFDGYPAPEQTVMEVAVQAFKEHLTKNRKRVN